MAVALACTTREQAQAVVADEVKRIQADGHYRSAEELRLIVKANIGYLAGYYSRDEAARLLDLFETEHPFFGKIEDWPKSPEDALKMGFDYAEAMKKRRRDALVSTAVENRTV